MQQSGASLALALQPVRALAVLVELAGSLLQLAATAELTRHTRRHRGPRVAPCRVQLLAAWLAVRLHANLNILT